MSYFNEKIITNFFFTKQTLHEREPPYFAPCQISPRCWGGYEYDCIMTVTFALNRGHNVLADPK